MCKVYIDPCLNVYLSNYHIFMHPNFAPLYILIDNLLCPKLKAWHAGESKWKNNTNINDYSIGIELENKGHEF